MKHKARSYNVALNVLTQVGALKFTLVDRRKIFRVKIYVFLRVFIGFMTYRRSSFQTTGVQHKTKQK